MPTFGNYETIGEPLVFRDEHGHASTVWKARKTDAPDSRQYIIKCYAPPRTSKQGESDERLDQDRALEFLEGIKQLKKTRSDGGRCLADIHDLGTSDAGAWYTADFFERKNLKSWIDLRGGVNSAALRHIVYSLVTGSLALKRARGYSHGNLKPSNIFLGGKRRPLRNTPLYLTDAYPAAPLQLARLNPKDRFEVGELLGGVMEAQDLRAIGELILQLVEGRLVSSGYDYNYPIASSPAWDALGKSGERWLELCNRLLDPQLSLDKINLESLAKEFRPSVLSGNLLRNLAIGGVVCLVAAGGFWEFVRNTPPPPPKPTNLVIAPNDIGLPPKAEIPQKKEIPSSNDPWEVLTKSKDFASIVTEWKVYAVLKTNVENFVQPDFDSVNNPNPNLVLYRPPENLGNLDTTEKTSQLTRLRNIGRPGNPANFTEWKNDLNTFFTKNYGATDIGKLVPIWLTEFSESNLLSVSTNLALLKQEERNPPQNFSTTNDSRALDRQHAGILGEKRALENKAKQGGKSHVALSVEAKKIQEKFATLRTNLKSALTAIKNAKKHEAAVKHENDILMTAESYVREGRYQEALDICKTNTNPSFEPTAEKARKEFKRLNDNEAFLKKGEYEKILGVSDFPPNKLFTSLTYKAKIESDILSTTSTNFAKGDYAFLTNNTVSPDLQEKPPFTNLFHNGAIESGQLTFVRDLVDKKKFSEASNFFRTNIVSITSKGPFQDVKNRMAIDIVEADKILANQFFEQGNSTKVSEICGKHKDNVFFDALAETNEIYIDALKKFKDADYLFIEKLNKNHGQKKPFSDLLQRAREEKRALDELNGFKIADHWADVLIALEKPAAKEYVDKNPFKDLRDWAAQRKTDQDKEKEQIRTQHDNELECLKIWFAAGKRNKKIDPIVPEFYKSVQLTPGDPVKKALNTLPSVNKIFFINRANQLHEEYKVYSDNPFTQKLLDEIVKQIKVQQ